MSLKTSDAIASETSILDEKNALSRLSTSHSVSPEVRGVLDGKGRHGLGLLWIKPPELALARPKAPSVAGRALSAPAGSQVHRLAPIAMRPLRPKSNRLLRMQGVGSGGPIGWLPGPPTTQMAARHRKWQHVIGREFVDAA
jgi:hypothetical protein